MELIRHLITNPDWWLKRPLAILLLILGYWLINHVLGNAITKLNGLLKKYRPTSSSYATILQRIIRWTLGLLLVLILRVWGADISLVWTTFMGMLAVIGVALLATWTMASNVTARFFIWFWQPVRLGQWIEIFPENLSGQVTEENLMFTELRQDDGHVIVIPNNLLFQRVVRRAPENGPVDAKG
jgi:small-conductance mechanosensitive channel